MKTPRHTYFIGFIILFSLVPFIQMVFEPFKPVGLSGAIEVTVAPEFSYAGIWKGTYQTHADMYIKDNSPFRGDLVRLRNQIDYSFFGNINSTLTRGKDNYVFDPNYIATREGNDLLHDSMFRIYDQRIAIVYGDLKKRGIPLIYCIAPNKANFYSEYLPHHSVAAARTNQSEFISLLQKHGVPVIDFDAWFLQQKVTRPYPLIPKYGAHWSMYGATLAADSILQTLQQLLGKDIARFETTGIEIDDQVRFTDDDYLPSLNLMTKWKNPPLAYPKLLFKPGYQPKVLAISDSYYWSFYDLQIVNRCFHPGSLYWYYNRSEYNTQRNKIKDRDERIPPDIIAQADVILLMSTGPSLKYFGYGFFEQWLNSMNHE